MGESVEPVLFAMARDYFPNPTERFRVMAALQMTAIVGTAVAPLYLHLPWEFCLFLLT